MKIQVLSDLHLEHFAFEPVATDADVIVLAGDICLGTRGIAWARQVWADKQIVFVPGNHEYYRSEIGFENEQMPLAGRIYDVHVLNRAEVIIQGVRFLGCTLWTDFALFGEAERPWAFQAALNGLTDFRVVDYGSYTFMPQDSAVFHAQDVAWLTQKLIHEPFAGETVVVTHHLPAWHSVSERYQKQLLSACFASRLEHLMGYSQLWIHGHTHDSLDYTLNGTRVICNPRGYCKAGQAPENADFNPALVIELKSGQKSG
jgi:predicted phosphodiesterase